LDILGVFVKKTEDLSSCRKLILV